VQIASSQTYSSYLWNTGDTMPNLAINHPGVYSLQVTDNVGCLGSDSILVSERACLEGVHVPNAFTPNGDGKNDFFNAISNTPFVSFELVVYSRFGEILFKTQSPGVGWDGKYKGAPMPAGAYVWMCRFHLINAGPELLKGTFILIR
jgi:gliding motility-associated-like protein